MEQNQTYRILSMYNRLCNGHVLYKKDEAALFGIGEKTIQRDIDHIRSYIELEKMDQYLVYDHQKRGYRLDSGDTPFLKNEEILAIVKILIESRAFPKTDMYQLIDKLTNLSQPNNQAFIKQLMLNEKHLYVDLQHKRSLFTLLWELANAVNAKKLIKIRYKREHDNKDQDRILQPVGLIFSEYYFYLIAYQTSRELSFPTIYRVDRITFCEVTNKHFKIPYSHRFQEGEFRKRIQFMHSGELMTIKFHFHGPSPQAVLDRIPTARIIQQEGNTSTFEAEVFGEGIKMWLLSQGNFIEVLAPSKLREDMITIIQKMKEEYKKN
jgi:predicted DNA-binding transcriptional regulator YafY